MGTFSGPEGGTSTIEKRQRSIKMKETSTVKLQMELQRYASHEKRCCKRFFFALIGKDIQKDFTKIYEILESLEFGLSAFSDVCFRRKGSSEGTIQVP